jgi:hypothetical protein
MDPQVLRTGLEKLRRPVQGSSAHEADRGGPSDPQGPAVSGPKEPAPKEPSKAGDEPARGLFQTEAKPLAATKIGSPKIPGVDVDDESQALVKLIEAAKAKLERQPPEAMWAKLCESLTGTTVLDMADPAALQDLLGLVTKLVDKDPGAIEKVRGLIAPAEANT